MAMSPTSQFPSWSELWLLAMGLQAHLSVYAEIRCRDVWYIVFGWHFYVRTSTASESLAEAVGSFLSVARRRNTNGNMSMKHLVWPSQLRAVDLKGFGGEDGIMAYALNTHFQCPGPEGWHLFAKRVNKEKGWALLNCRRSFAC